jgi:hypothetical protein
VTPPYTPGFLSGISTAFSFGASHQLEKGALIKKDTALHVHVRHGTKSAISTQIRALRHILLDVVGGELEEWSKNVVQVRGNSIKFIPILNSYIMARVLCHWLSQHIVQT